MGKPPARKRWLGRVLLISAILCATVVALSMFARMWIHRASRDRLYTRVVDVPKCRVAVVLGAKVYESGELCDTLRDRVDAAIDLYKAGRVEVLLMSGDNRFKNYDEPTRMMEYAVNHGVNPNDVKMDYAGRRTYDSVYRAKHIFGLDKFVIVSQSYHLERAIFLSQHLGAEACGYCADSCDDPVARERENLARVSALFDVYVLHPKPMLGKKERI